MARIIAVGAATAEALAAPVVDASGAPPASSHRAADRLAPPVLSRCRRRRARRRRRRGCRVVRLRFGVVGGGPARRFLGCPREPDAVGADLGMPQVQADPAGEATLLRPRVGHVAAGGGARHRRDDSAVHARGARRACRCRAASAQRDPHRVVGVRRVRPTGPARRGRPRSRDDGRGWAAAATSANASGPSTDSAHATSSARGAPGRNAPKKRRLRWTAFISPTGTRSR